MVLNPLSPGTVIGESMGRERTVLASTVNAEGISDYLVLTQYGLWHFLVEYVNDTPEGFVTLTMNSYSDRDKAESVYKQMGGKY